MTELMAKAGTRHHRAARSAQEGAFGYLEGHCLAQHIGNLAHLSFFLSLSNQHILDSLA